MHKVNDLEINVTNLVETKVLNLDVTLASLVKGGVLSGLDPWDVWCGNGWIVRRWPGPRRDLAAGGEIRQIVREEVGALMAGGGRPG